MAVIMVVRTLDDWLDGLGARRDDLLIDRAGESEPDYRYMLTRRVRGAEPIVSGRIFQAHLAGHLEFIERYDLRTLTPPSSSASTSHLRLASGNPSPPGRPAPRWQRR